MQTVNSADEFLMVHQRGKISELHEKALRIMEGSFSINFDEGRLDKCQQCDQSKPLCDKLYHWMDNITNCLCFHKRALYCGRMSRQQYR